MKRWVRVENSMVQEIVTYNPFEVINENFHHLFKECNDDNVDVFWSYDEKSGIFSEPPLPPLPPLDSNLVGIAST